MMAIDLIHIVKVIVALVFLIEASRRDLKERLISNKLWMYMIIIFIPLDCLEYYIKPFSIVFAVAQFVFIFLFSYLIYWIGLYGGADAKALMSLAIAFPVYPKFLNFPVLGTGMGIFTFSTLANSVIVAPLLVIFLLIRNLVKGDLKFPHCLIGYREKVENIKFHNLLEYVEGGKVVRKLRSIEATDEELRKLRNAGITEVWVSPALPFICFITAGFLTAVFAGDLIYLAIKFLLS
ncbi:MAG: peptidase A24 [Archaeoglobus sp.]|jgi:preflagellin peptidase FlaK|nr:MAG: peptidase A24 [Archaeoglobus sp.]